MKKEKVSKKVKCQYCEKKISHMIVILDKKGDVHVHAPFNNPTLMEDFIGAIVREQNKYNFKKKKN